MKPLIFSKKTNISKLMKKPNNNIWLYYLNDYCTSSTITYIQINTLKRHSSQPSLLLTLKSLILMRPLSSGTLLQTSSPHSPVAETVSQPHSSNLPTSAPPPTPHTPCLECRVRLQSLPSQVTLNIIRRLISPVQKIPKLLTACIIKSQLLILAFKDLYNLYLNLSNHISQITESRTDPSQMTCIFSLGPLLHASCPFLSVYPNIIYLFFLFSKNCTKAKQSSSSCECVV